MKRITSILLLSMLTLISWNCNKPEEEQYPEFELKTADNLSDTEYQIYSLILNDQFTNFSTFIIEQQTNKLNAITLDKANYKFLSNEIENIDSMVVVNFLELNDSTYNLDNKFIEINCQYKLISGEEVSYLFNNKDVDHLWDEFYDQYPDSNGMISFTRIGFNNEMTEAILELAHSYGSLGANGQLVFLVKDNGEWKIIKTIPTWIS